MRHHPLLGRLMHRPGTPNVKVAIPVKQAGGGGGGTVGPQMVGA